MTGIGFLVTLALVTQSGSALQAGQGFSKGTKLARAASLLMLLKAAAPTASEQIRIVLWEDRLEASASEANALHPNLALVGTAFSNQPNSPTTVEAVDQYEAMVSAEEHGAMLQLLLEEFRRELTPHCFPDEDAREPLPAGPATTGPHGL